MISATRSIIVAGGVSMTIRAGWSCMALAFACVGLAQCSSESSGQKQVGDPNDATPVDRGSYGPPRLGGATVSIDGQPFHAGILQVETASVLTVGQARELETRAAGKLCGASAFSDVYFLCLDQEAGTADALLAIVHAVEPFGWVTGVGPVWAKMINAPGCGIEGSCNPAERKHLARLKADDAMQALQASGKMSGMPAVHVVDVGFHWFHESLQSAWTGQALDCMGGWKPPAGEDTMCPNGVLPSGARDCDVYFHDPLDIFSVDHGTTVASAAAGLVVGVVPGLKITPLKAGQDWLDQPPQGSAGCAGGAQAVALCMAVEAAIHNNAVVINLSFEVEKNPVIKDPTKPPGYCGMQWWQLQLETLNQRNGVLTITPGNKGKDVDVETDAQPLLDMPATILVGATKQDSAARWDDWLLGSEMISGYRSKHAMVYAPGGGLCLAAHDAVGQWPPQSSNSVYTNMYGTSFAAPQIAAIAAAMKAVNPTLSAAQIQEILLQTGVPVWDGKHPDSREVRFDQALAAAMNTCATQCAMQGAKRCDAGVAESCELVYPGGCRYWVTVEDCGAAGKTCVGSDANVHCDDPDAGAGGAAGAAGSGGAGPDASTGGSAGMGASAGAGGADAGAGGAAGSGGEDAGPGGSAGAGGSAGTAGSGGSSDGGGIVYGAGYSCEGGLTCSSQDCCAYVSINGASFGMGRSTAGTDVCPAGQTCDASELPEHPITVMQQYMDVFEVTVGRFRQFLAVYDGAPPQEAAGEKIGQPGSGWQSAWNANLLASSAAVAAALHCDATMATWTDAPGANESLPVNCATWYEAMAFCLWQGTSLPTEAQWEFAAAAGAQNRTYPWGNPGGTIGPGQLSYACGGDGAPGCGLTDISAAGAKPYGDSADGIKDLGGNVAEWALDWFDPSFYASAQVGPMNLTSTGLRAVRGGSWTDILTRLRAASRVGLAPDTRSAQVGIRCTY
jgi:formylglycine-generating enzyme